MSGTFGLTAAGQELDRYVTALTDRKLARRVNTFVGKATLRIQRAQEYDDDVVMLAMRAYYKQLASKLMLELYPASLLQCYIHTITSPQFIPTTRNQMGLLRLAARLGPTV